MLLSLGRDVNIKVALSSLQFNIIYVTSHCGLR